MPINEPSSIQLTTLLSATQVFCTVWLDLLTHVIRFPKWIKSILDDD